METKANKEKVTVYFNSGLCGMGKLEGKLESFTQSDNQPQHGSVKVVPKGCRKAKWLTTMYQPYLLVVKGWGHPEVPSAFHPAESSNGCTVQRGKYMSGDPAIEADFHAATSFESSDVVFEVGR